MVEEVHYAWLKTATTASAEDLMVGKCENDEHARRRPSRNSCFENKLVSFIFSKKNYTHKYSVCHVCFLSFINKNLNYIKT